MVLIFLITPIWAGPLWRLSLVICLISLTFISMLPFRVWWRSLVFLLGLSLLVGFLSLIASSNIQSFDSPFRDPNELDLILDSQGKWNILEPPKELWGNPDKEVTPQELDMIMVPGTGFDRSGGRMGNGQGYYDRTMEQVRPDCSLIALCYESQLFDKILVAPHDVYMDKVVTESNVYEGKGRG